MMSIMGKLLNVPYALESVEEQRKKAFSHIIKKYGVEYAKNIERAVRYESGHFKSGQWKVCNTPGMVKQAKEFPWAWTYLDTWSNKLGLIKHQFGVSRVFDTHEGPLQYVQFPNEYLGIIFFADFIHNVRGGDIKSWYRRDIPSMQQARQNYWNGLMAVTPKIVNSLI